MDNQKYEMIYLKIANKVNEIIPTKWDKILLNAEIEPGVVSSYYCFYETESGELVEFGDIPKRYGINRSSFRHSELEITRLIRELNSEFVNNHQEAWTIMTFILENDGEYHIDYSYENLSETNELYRREQWEKKYLGI